ncbi:MAG TPA: NIPSNAP family protein [Stellaceae bacterium]|nr:NIPSNAP family protein [Stellaceae bacterium]
MITCFIRYEIDPFRHETFDAYARVWGQVIPRCGGDLIGYFSPHEGSSTTAYGVYSIPSLAEYEAYRARLREDEQARANFEMARREQFIRREDRIFLRLSSAPHAAVVRAG